jgi:hypothetical protein
MNENTEVLIDLKGSLERVLSSIETVKDKQDEMATDIAKIKEAVYNPDEGIYARLRELEQWKGSSTRLIWIVATATIGMLAAYIFRGVLQ